MEPETDQAVAEELLLPTTQPGSDDTADAPDNGPTTVEELPEWAQKELSKARREAAKYRNAAKGKAPEADTDSIKAEARREMLGEVVAAKIEAALTGVVDDPSSIVEDLDLTRYITEDGIDDEAIAALKSKYTRIVKRPGVGQGRTGSKPAGSAADQFADVLRSLGA